MAEIKKNSTIIKNGNLKEVIKIAEQNNIKIYHKPDAAIVNGHLDIVEYIYKKYYNCSYHYSSFMKLADESNQTALAEFLFSQFSPESLYNEFILCMISKISLEFLKKFSLEILKKIFFFKKISIIVLLISNVGVLFIGKKSPTKF